MTGTGNEMTANTNNIFLSLPHITQLSCLDLHLVGFLVEIVLDDLVVRVVRIAFQ